MIDKGTSHYIMLNMGVFYEKKVEKNENVSNCERIANFISIMSMYSAMYWKNGLINV